MDPLIAFDAQRIIPNRFALAIAAAGRARALARGSKPRLSGRPGDNAGLALGEIAAAAFEPDEIEPFLLAGSLPRTGRDHDEFPSGEASRRRAGPARHRTALQTRAAH